MLQLIKQLVQFKSYYKNCKKLNNWCKLSEILLDKVKRCSICAIDDRKMKYMPRKV